MEIKIDFKKTIKADFILLAILGLAAFLRFYHIGFQSPWLDELSTMQVTDPDIPFSETDVLLMTRDGFPHFYFLSLKYLSTIFGHTIVVLRTFSAIAGIAAVYVIYLLGKELISKRAGYIAALLLCVNLFHIYHSQEARCYSLLVFFVVLSAYRMVVYIKRPTMANAAWFGFSAGLIPNAHIMGFLNVLVLYTTLLVFLLFQTEKAKIFKQLLISGIIAILTVLPVYPMLSRVSKVSSFWAPEPTLEVIKGQLVEMMGSSLFMFYIYLAATVIFFSILIYKIFRTKDFKTRQTHIIIAFMLFFWIVINIGAIVVKSYLDFSIIVNRYFIGTMPAFIIMAAYCVSQISNKYLSSIVAGTLITYSLYFLHDKQYYFNIYKSRWDLLSKEMIVQNTNNDMIYGSFGYVSNILFKGTPSYHRMKAMTFADYLKTVKSNIIKKEDFWYFDGNFRPYNLSVQDQQYLDENYVLDKRIDKFDCWARHYKVKASEQDSDKIFLSFPSATLDEKGQIVMLQNGTIESFVRLTKGTYEFTFDGISMPNPSIDNVNAHLVIKLGNKQIWNGYLSEKPENKSNKATFSVDKNGDHSLTITFDNDIFKDERDRNLVITFMELRKISD